MTLSLPVLPCAFELDCLGLCLFLVLSSQLLPYSALVLQGEDGVGAECWGAGWNEMRLLPGVAVAGAAADWVWWRGVVREPCGMGNEDAAHQGIQRREVPGPAQGG
eukprot:1137717-Pelagomonas_calceolata.AAC.1